MIEYRRARMRIGWLLCILLMVNLPFAFTFLSSNQPEEDRMTSLALEREEAMLEPWDDSLTRILMPKWEGESEKDYEQRLAQFVKSRQEEQTRILQHQQAKEKQLKETNRFTITLMILGSSLVVVVFLNGVYNASRYPIVFVMTADYIEFPESRTSSYYRIKWSDVALSQYVISTHRVGESVYKDHKVLLKATDGRVLGTIDLSKLEQSDFNILHRDINSLVPHMTWIYP